MKPQPISPMKLFIKELRKKNWVPDPLLKKTMAPVLASNGTLEDLKKILLEKKILSLAQMGNMALLMKQKTSSTPSKALSITETTHPEEFLDNLKDRMEVEIKTAKHQAEAKTKQFKKKLQEKKEKERSPLKIMIKEIRRQKWCPDDKLKSLVKEVIDSGGSPKSLVDRLMKLKILNPHQKQFLYGHTKEVIQEKKKKSEPLVKDALSDLEKSLGGELGAIEEETPKVKKTPPSPFAKRSALHSKQVRILSDEEDDDMGFFGDSGQDDEENNRFF